MSEMVVSAAGPVPQVSQLSKSTAKTIYIVSALDVMAALVENQIDDNFYMFDNNKTGGSTNLGTNALSTAVRPGDTVVWMMSGLEVETFTEIKAITGPAVEKLGIYQSEYYGTSFWTCTIGAGVCGTFEYAMDVQVESKIMKLTSTPSIYVIEEEAR